MAHIVYGSTKIDLDPSVKVDRLRDDVMRALRGGGEPEIGPNFLRVAGYGGAMLWLLVTPGVPVLITEDAT